jgi:hypothetical protein
MAQIWATIGPNLVAKFLQKQNAIELTVTPIQIQTRGVSHGGLALYIQMAKEELWKLK